MEVTTVKLAGSWGLDITPIGKVYPVPPALSQTFIRRVFIGYVVDTGGAIRKRLALASVELNRAAQFGVVCGVVVTVRTYAAVVVACSILLQSMGRLGITTVSKFCV